MEHTVLYVDDEEVNLQLFYYTFRREFNVLTANSAKKGLEILKKEKVDIVLTDQKMPEMTGVEFLEEINKRFPGIPPNRLMISGYAQNEVVDKAFKEYKLYKFISKPWDANELKDIIISAIDNSNG